MAAGGCLPGLPGTRRESRRNLKKFPDVAAAQSGVSCGDGATRRRRLAGSHLAARAAADRRRDWRSAPMAALSRMLQGAFSREWQRLRPFMCALDADWAPPETGYFSVLHASFAQLLDEHEVLSVPASVFGSPHEDLSIVTCLYSLAEHTGAFQS